MTHGVTHGRAVFSVPGVVAVPRAMADAPATHAGAGGELGPAGPGPVDLGGAELVRGHAAALQAPLVQRGERRRALDAPDGNVGGTTQSTGR